MTTLTKKSHRKLAMAIAVASCFATQITHALPSAPTVVSGTATFAQSGNALTVTNTPGAIINWQQFSIGAGQSAHFQQQTSASSVLNLVIGGNLSAIYGSLSSNGRVWLVNPAGIMVGATGRIDVAGFVASTLNVTNADFLANRLNFGATPGFSAGAGSVTIDPGARITTPSGGSVYLVGAQVTNAGVVTTPQGETILAAGESVQLIDTATPGVRVEITGASGTATNLGEISATAGRIGIAGVIVRNSGELNASSAVSEGGRIFLRASKDAYVDGAGRIVTTGTSGGHVEVLGERVAIKDQALIDASAIATGGNSGNGGTILVGGDYQGRNPDIPNAQIAYFGADARMLANAGAHGDGGKVILWADDTTRAYGAIEARGGQMGGDGGFVETSGKRYLDVLGMRGVDTRAPMGATGDWLLDPYIMYITDTIAPSNDLLVVGTPAEFRQATANHSYFLWSQLATQLTATSINVTTVNYGGDILFQQSAPWVSASTNDLTFTAASGQIYGNWGGGPGVLPTSGLMLQTAGSISFVGANGVYLGNGKIETTGAGKSISVTAANGAAGIGLLKAVNGAITVNTQYSIFDTNGRATGTAGLNYVTTGNVSLHSSYGAESSCVSSTGGKCLAISGDVAGTPNLSAVVDASAQYGGINVRYHGDVGSGKTITIQDNSDTSSGNPYSVNYNFVNFEVLGNAVLGSGGATMNFGALGGFHVDTTGSLTWGSGIGFPNIPQEIGLSARGDLTLNATLPIASLDPMWDEGDTFIGLLSGNHLTVNADLTNADGDIGLVAGNYDVISKTDTDFDDFFDIFTATTGTIDINAAITAAATPSGEAGSVGFIANQVNLNSSAAQLNGENVEGVVGDSIKMTGGASIVAVQEVSLGFLSAGSLLDMSAGSKVEAQSPQTIYLDFLARTSGGVMLDGVQAAGSYTNALGTGLYAGGAPAILGTNLFITYGVIPSNPVDQALSNALGALSGDSLNGVYFYEFDETTGEVKLVEAESTFGFDDDKDDGKKKRVVGTCPIGA
jgi:filamentous hemagglutinin family protein